MANTMIDQNDPTVIVKKPGLQSFALNLAAPVATTPKLNSLSSIGAAPTPSSPASGDNDNLMWSWDPGVVAACKPFLLQILFDLVEFANMDNQMNANFTEFTLKFGEAQAEALWQKGFDAYGKDMMTFATDATSAAIAGVTVGLTVKASAGYDTQMREQETQRNAAEQWKTELEKPGLAGRQIGPAGEPPAGVELSKTAQAQLLGKVQSRAAFTEADTNTLQHMSAEQLDRASEAAGANIKANNDRINGLSAEKQAATQQYQMVQSLFTNIFKAGFDIGTAVYDLDYAQQDKSSAMYQTMVSISEQIASSATSSRDRMLSMYDSLLQAMEKAGEMSTYRG